MSYSHIHDWLVHCGYCQTNITCRTSSNPDLIQNFFLSTQIFYSLDIHSEQMSQCASHSCLRDAFFCLKSALSIFGIAQSASRPSHNPLSKRQLPDVRLFLKMSQTIWTSVYIPPPKRSMPKYRRHFKKGVSLIACSKQPLFASCSPRMVKSIALFYRFVSSGQFGHYVFPQQLNLLTV